MSVMLVLIGASLVVAIFFLIAFIWSVKTGQYEDDISPAHTILFEDKPTTETNHTSTKKAES